MVGETDAVEQGVRRVEAGGQARGLRRAREHHLIDRKAIAEGSAREFYVGAVLCGCKRGCEQEEEREEAAHRDQPSTTKLMPAFASSRLDKASAMSAPGVQ